MGFSSKWLDFQLPYLLALERLTATFEVVRKRVELRNLHLPHLSLLCLTTEEGTLSCKHFRCPSLAYLGIFTGHILDLEQALEHSPHLRDFELTVQDMEVLSVEAMISLGSFSSLERLQIVGCSSSLDPTTTSLPSNMFPCLKDLTLDLFSGHRVAQSIPFFLQANRLEKLELSCVEDIEAHTLQQLWSSFPNLVKFHLETGPTHPDFVVL
jgi:hypothetical protein